MKRRFGLTFPLLQRQVGVIQGLIVRQRLRLLLHLPELAEERQLQGLRRARPALRVQEEHLLQDANRCDAQKTTKAEVLRI